MSLLNDLIASQPGQIAAVPFAVAFLVTLVLAAAGGAAGRHIAAFGIGAGFLVAFYLIQSGIPPFPPPQTAHKVFYVGALGLILGLALDAAGLTRAGGHLLAFVLPIGALWWMRQSQIAAGPSTALVISLAALFVVSVLVYWRQAATARGSDSMESSSAALFPPIQLLVVAIGLGGITLLSFSLTNGSLSLALSAATGGYLLVSYLAHALGGRGFGYGATGAFGGGGAWLLLLYGSVFVAEAPLHYWLLGVVSLAFVADFVARPLALGAPLGTGGFARLVRPLIYGFVVGIPPAAALAYVWFVLGWRLPG
jgi:hypothetical protein